MLRMAFTAASAIAVFVAGADAAPRLRQAGWRRGSTVPNFKKTRLASA
jgi:hypothetical protein